MHGNAKIRSNCLHSVKQILTVFFGYGTYNLIRPASRLYNFRAVIRVNDIFYHKRLHHISEYSLTSECCKIYRTGLHIGLTKGTPPQVVAAVDCDSIFKRSEIAVNIGFCSEVKDIIQVFQNVSCSDFVECLCKEYIAGVHKR